MPPAYEVLLLNTAIPQIQAAQSGDTYVVPRDIAFSAALTLSAGTANGVPYLNGSKVLTTGSALTFDGTNLSNTRSVATAFSGTNAATWANGIVLTNTATPAAGVASLILFQGISNVNSAFGVTQNASGFGDFVWASYTGSFSEQMRLTSTGLGIGTSSPGSRIHGAVAANGTPVLTVQNTSSSQSSYGILFDTELNNAGSRNWALISEYAAVGDFHIVRSNAKDGNPFSAGTSVLALDSSGNLGLGVTPSAFATAQKALQVLNGSFYSDASSTGLQYNSFYNGTNEKYIADGYATSYYQSSGQHIWRTAASGTAGGNISFTQRMTLLENGNLGIGETNPTTILNIKQSTGPIVRLVRTSNRFELSADNDFMSLNARDASTYINFKTGDTERARIDSLGSFLVDATSTAVTNDGLVYLSRATTSVPRTILGHASGTVSGGAYIEFFLAGVNIGSVTQNGTTGVLYNITSDYRLKDVVGAVTGAGARIDALKPVDYIWKADGSAARGFLAHEFQEVYPNSVTGTKDAVDEEGKPVYQNMQASTSEVIADLVAEIQSLRARVAQLEQGA